MIPFFHYLHGKFVFVNPVSYTKVFIHPLIKLWRASVQIVSDCKLVIFQETIAGTNRIRLNIQCLGSLKKAHV